MTTFVPLDRISASRAGRTGTVPYLLISPPMTDPTTPYHSIPYLVGAARAAGHGDVRCLDANLEAFEYLARPEQFGALIEQARKSRVAIEGAVQRTRRDEIRYRRLLAAEGLAPHAAQEAIAVFRDPERFYHLPTYKAAVSIVRRWLRLLSADTPVGLFDDEFAWYAKAEMNLCSTADLADPALCAAVAAPFARYLDDGFRAVLESRPWAVVGFSVNFTCQLPIALHMARIVRAVRPGAVVVFGGTEVGDVTKYTADRDAVWRVFEPADLIVPGEGESALIGILDAVCDGADFGGISGVLRRQDSTYQIRYESLTGLPEPAYDVWEWERYWAPEPLVLYSPTRGCYWNKCTFCDYGLNSDRPTSPSRDRSLDDALAELAGISRFARFVYFSVDAMSPRFLKGLAEGIVAAGLPIVWSAELRLERTWPRRSVGALLAASGCVAISFGYESGSQRVLDLIDKGVQIADVPAVLEELAKNGIAAQMMGFTGFPTETAAEARRTYEFLAEHREHWTLSGIGPFLLTQGSIVAKRPEAFGVELLPPSPSDDVRRYVPWRDAASGVENWPSQEAAEDVRLLRGGVQDTLFDRPFVGGIDSTHTLLYFARYGRRLVPEDGDAGADGPPRISGPTPATVVVPFDGLGELATTREFRDELCRRTARGADTTAAGLADWLAAPGSARPGSATIAITADGRLAELGADLDVDSDTPLGRALRILLGANA